MYPSFFGTKLLKVSHSSSEIASVLFEESVFGELGLPLKIVRLMDKVLLIRSTSLVFNPSASPFRHPVSQRIMTNRCRRPKECASSFFICSRSNHCCCDLVFLGNSGRSKPSITLCLTAYLRTAESAVQCR